MRFIITLRVNAHRFGRLLPLNYQYEMSAAIYKTLSSGNEDFAAWLHNNGFQTEEGKQFKLFTFSRFNVPSFRILRQSNQMELKSEYVQWQISFWPENSTEKFIEGIFQDRVFEIGNRESKVQFEVANIEILPPPEFQETMCYNALSPISVSFRDESGRDNYPGAPQDFAQAEWVRERLLVNLLDKYSAFYGENFPRESFLDFSVMSEPKSSLVTIKAGTPQETRVRGFMCRFALRTAPELQRIAYEAGLGELNSQGFGCLGLM
ncbi:MAG: CRISPR-associated endoribonuclease Cas6 [Bacteroidales bacterium]|nr:CRISPR-associated endoribonuclease Cas6 [Bacteroidales bacterium]